MIVRPALSVVYKAWVTNVPVVLPASQMNSVEAQTAQLASAPKNFNVSATAPKTVHQANNVRGKTDVLTVSSTRIVKIPPLHSV